MIRENKPICYVFLAFVMLLAASLDGIFGVLAPAIQREFAWEGAELSALFTTNLLGFLIATPVGGILCGRRGHRAVYLLGFFLAAAGGAAVLLVRAGWQMGIAAFLLGAGTGMLTIAANTLIPVIAGAGAARLMNWFHLCYAGGAAGSKKLLGELLARQADWRMPILTITALLLIPFLAMLFVAFPKTAESAPPRGVFHFSGIKSRSFWTFTLRFGCCIASESLTVNWLVSYAVSYGRDPGQASTYLSLFFIGGMAGKLLFPLLFRGQRLERNLGWFGLLAAAATAAGILLGDAGLPAIAAGGLFASVLYPSSIAAASRDFPAPRQFWVSLAISAGSCCNLLLNAGFGLLRDGAGPQASYWTIPALFGMFALSFLLKQRGEGLPNGS